MQDTLMESEGSEPDRAAFLAAARLSTSSARYARKELIGKNKSKNKIQFSCLVFLCEKTQLTNQDKHQIVCILNHFLNILEKFSNLT